jgi:predicted lipoprotein with Yx(FWY)xxD motif
MKRMSRRALGVVGTSAGLSLLVATGAGAATLSKAPVVVKAASRPKVGVILVAVPGGATLYRDTNDPPNTPTCTGGCAAVWPAYVLPAGDKVPKGVKGLGTVKLSDGDLQVTYNQEPLYTFVDDSGHSVNGNGDGPFEVVAAP